jgi:MGT family glycosyltransferase
MAKVVVLNLPEHGHMNATYPVVKELVHQGEQVLYYATDPFRVSVEAAGAEYFSYGDAGRFAPPAHAGGLHSVMAWQMGLAEHLLPQLIEEIKAADPDYLLIDSMCLWANLLVQVLKIPAVCMASVFVPNPKVVSVDDMIHAGYASAPKPVLLAGIDALNTYIETSRRVDHAYGTLSPDIVEFFSNYQSLNLIFTTRAFHPEGKNYDETYKFVGPMIDPARCDADEAGDLQLSGDGPLVYVSLGTIFNDQPDFYRTCVAAFDQAPFRVLIATGSKVDRAVLGPRPANVVLRERVPQLEVLRRASLFVTHGGMNSVNEALAFGVPLLVFPQHGDQHLVAGRVLETGTGLRLTPADITPQKIRALADTLLTQPEFAAHARDMAEECARGGGAPAAVDALRSFSAGCLKQKAGCEA